MEDIQKTAELFLERNETVEVRVIERNIKRPKDDIVSSGYYTKPDALVEAVSIVDDNPNVKGVYITLNKPKLEHTSRLNQPISRSTRKLSDRSMDRLTLMLIDLDPERETSTNSTATELEEAHLRCMAVVDALSERDFPQPALFMSGNGWHALYAIDSPVEDKPLVRDFLKALNHKFSDDVVKVDTTVYNPARITKLYGTMTRKGPDTEERPQRRSAIESIPDSFVEVTRDQLQVIVDKWSAPKKKEQRKQAANHKNYQRNTQTQRTTVDVPAFCQNAGLEIIGTKINADSTIYQLEECGFNPEHQNNDASIIQSANGVTYYQCFHDSCQGETFQELCKFLNCYPDEWGDNNKAFTGLNNDSSWPEVTLFDDDSNDDHRPEYPFEALPVAIRRASKEVARFCKVSAVAPSIVGISVIATAIGKKAVIEERPGLTHHPALFIMGEAGPSERKTPTFKAMSQPLNLWAKNQEESYKTELASAKLKSSLIDSVQAKKHLEAKKAGADLDKIEKEMLEVENERPSLPVSPRRYTTDATEQRLFQMMEAHGGAYSVLTGEGRTIINSILGRYSDGTGEALYLAGISGDPITRDRVGNQTGPEEKTIYDPCLNVCIMVQPDKALELIASPAMQASGLVARIWRNELPPTAGTREEGVNESGLNPFVLDDYNQVVTKILDTAPREEPHKAKLNQEVREARRQFHNEIERQLCANGALSDVADIAGKCCSQTVKAALVFHITDNPSALNSDESEVSMETWIQAEAIGRFHLQESVRLQRLASGDILVEKCKKVAQWLISKDIRSLKKGDLMRSGPRPRLNKNDAKDVLDYLIDYGVVVKLNKNSTYTVNPGLFKKGSQIARVARTPLEIEKLKINSHPATPATLATSNENLPPVQKCEFNDFKKVDNIQDNTLLDFM